MSEAGVDRITARIETLALISDEPGCLTRMPLGPAQRKVAALIETWMREAGLVVTRDGAGNLRGDLPREDRDTRPVLALGSHFDTVRDAGKYDGTLGILTGLEAVEQLRVAGELPDVGLRVLAFEDEEGICFGSSKLGSYAYVGLLTAEDLESIGNDGITLAERLTASGLSPEGALAAEGPAHAAYVELHIEQGPVLEMLGQPVGVVTSIAGQARFSVALSGAAGHAGTVPMAMRRDALAGAAEGILAVEAIAKAHGSVGTVGEIACHPGAINVIPGQVRFSVDLRSGNEHSLAEAKGDLRECLEAIATRRNLSLDLKTISSVAPTPCHPVLQEQIARAIGPSAPRLESGAGHDAIAMSRKSPVGMIFLACRDGVSHDPAEHVARDDIATALEIMKRFVRNFNPLAL